MSREEYFLLTLNIFLADHECDVELNGNQMYTLLERKTYGRWWSELYDAYYALEDFGIVYTKLYYVVRTFCERSSVINKNSEMLHRTEEIKKRLDSGIINISVL